MIAAQWKKYLLVLAGLLVAVLAIGAIKIDPPANLRGELIVQGRIAHCDFQSIGLRGGQFFMGVTLDTPGTPMLRFNGPARDRKTYEAMCGRKPAVRISYHAVKRVLGPVRFWIDRVSEA